MREGGSSAGRSELLKGFGLAGGTRKAQPEPEAVTWRLRVWEGEKGTEEGWLGSCQGA